MEQKDLKGSRIYYRMETSYYCSARHKCPRLQILVLSLLSTSLTLEAGRKLRGKIHICDLQFSRLGKGKLPLEG